MSGLQGYVRSQVCDRAESAVYSTVTSQFGVIRNMLTLNIIFAEDKSHVSQSCVLSVCNISKCKQPGSRSRVAGVLLTNINHFPLN